MSLAEAADLNPPRSRGPLCSVRVARDEMDEDDRKLLDEWLADRRVPATRITRILVTAGYKVGSDAVSRHRNGECGCRNA
jgi:hypothetical protein